MDWAAWSRECVALMAERTKQLLSRNGLAMGAPYQWDLEAATLVIGGVTFGLEVVATVAGDSVLWAWANDSLPAAATARIGSVRSFGEEHDLDLLANPCAPGGLAQAKECVAIAGRVLDASAIWIDETGVGWIVFAVFAPTPAGA